MRYRRVEAIRYAAVCRRQSRKGSSGSCDSGSGPRSSSGGSPLGIRCLVRGFPGVRRLVGDWGRRWRVNAANAATASRVSALGAAPLLIHKGQEEAPTRDDEPGLGTWSTRRWRGGGLAWSFPAHSDRFALSCWAAVGRVRRRVGEPAVQTATAAGAQPAPGRTAAGRAGAAVESSPRGSSPWLAGRNAVPPETGAGTAGECPDKCPAAHWLRRVRGRDLCRPQISGPVSTLTQST